MIQALHRTISLIEGDWGSKHVVVIGDIMLDRYVWGDVERISPEAPVPVVRVAHQTEQPGGAANVAMNIVGLGGKATLLGFQGDDEAAKSLSSLLKGSRIDARVVTAAQHPTTIKLRVMAGSQQILRLDTESTSLYSAEHYSALLENLESAVAQADALILSDYAKGTLTESISQRAIQLARVRKIPVLVDPKQRSFERYRGATTICPNLTELSIAAGLPPQDIVAILAAGQGMVRTLDLGHLTVTMSERGIALLGDNLQFIAPAVARQVSDVSGAGDAVIATLALSMAADLEMKSAVQLANLAAGIVVAKVGTVPVTRDELLVSLSPEVELNPEEKLLSLEALRTRVSAWRTTGHKIVFTNGCFDLLHVGHVTLLEVARREGDRLIVAINSDSSVRQLKGTSRPIVGQEERARILAAMSAVDAVIPFDDPTPLLLIEALRPDVIVKGGDYTEDTVVGAKEVRSWGGRVKIVPTVEGFSTTSIIAKAMTPGTGS